MIHLDGNLVMLLVTLIVVGGIVIIAYLNRNRPECICDCHDDGEDDEVIAMGGECEEDDDEDGSP